MFIKIKVDTTRDTSMDEALINTDQITWIDIEDKHIRFADASFLYVPELELERVIMAITEKAVIEDNKAAISSHLSFHSELTAGLKRPEGIKYGKV